MSSRQSRKSTTTTTVVTQSSKASSSGAHGGEGTSTPSRGSGAGMQSPSPGRRSRADSPTLISRRQEKQTLVDLNSRLAQYIDRVRFLETENKSLSTKIQGYEEEITREVSQTKDRYENEIALLRKALDEAAKEKAKLQVEVGKYKSDAETWKDKYQKAARDLAATEKRALAAESQVSDLQARLNDAINQRKHWENEFTKITIEVKTLEKQLETAKKQLEDETIQRADLQNRVQTLKEENAFQNSLHEQEMNETVRRTEISVSETDGKFQREYERRLQDALEEMRKENEYNIRITREETEEAFTSKLSELRRLADQRDGLATSSYEELRTTRKRIDELAQENTRLKNLLNTAEARIGQLEDQLRREQEEHEVMINNRDAEIRRLREQIEDHLQEYRDLMDTKIALDLELNHYHKMLEAEEIRLNISSSETSMTGTPRRVVQASRKRKRQMHDRGTAQFESSASASSDVVIHEVDEEGKHIKLHNKSDEKEYHLGGWVLKHIADDEHETNFKFHRSVIIKPGAYITVHSSDQEVTHAPPHDLVMKNQRFYAGETMKTTLHEPKGDEKAARTMKKVIHYAEYSGVGDEIDSGFEGDPNQEKCVLM